MKEQLEQAPVVPVVVIEDADKAVKLANALVEGGLPIIEVTMRIVVVGLVFLQLAK